MSSTSTPLARSPLKKVSTQLLSYVGTVSKFFGEIYVDIITKFSGTLHSCPQSPCGAQTVLHTPVEIALGAFPSQPASQPNHKAVDSIRKRSTMVRYIYICVCVCIYMYKGWDRGMFGSGMRWRVEYGEVGSECRSEIIKTLGGKM